MGFVKDSASTFATQILMQIARFGSSVLIARFLLPAGKGAYVLITLIPLTVVSLGNIGIAGATVHFTSRKEHPPGEIAANVMSFALFMGIVYGIVVFFMGRGGDLSFIKGIDSSYYAIIAIAIPFMMMSRSQQAILQGQSRIAERNLTFLAEVFTITTGVILFVVVFRFGLPGAVFSWFAGIIAGALTGFFMVRPTLTFERIPDTVILRKILGFGIKAHFGALALFLLLNSDKYLINYFLGDGQTQVGLYSVATGLIMIIVYVPESISVVFLPRVTSMQNESARTLTTSVSRIAILFALIAITIAAVGAWPIIYILYGLQYMNSVLPFLILLPGIFFISISSILNNALQARKIVMVGTIASITGFICNIVLNLWFIPAWGINGAAFTSTISYSVVSMIILYWFLKETGAGLVETMVPGKNEIQSIVAIVRRRAIPKLRKITGI